MHVFLYLYRHRDHVDDQRGLEWLSYDSRLRELGLIQPGEVKAQGRHCRNLPVSEEGSTRELEKDFLHCYIVIKQGATVLKLTWVCLD